MDMTETEFLMNQYSSTVLEKFEDLPEDNYIGPENTSHPFIETPCIEKNDSEDC